MQLSRNVIEVQNVIPVIAECDKVSTIMFQEMFSIDYYTARDIFRRLVELEIIFSIYKDKDEKDVIHGVVNKKKIKEFTLN